MRRFKMETTNLIVVFALLYFTIGYIIAKVINKREKLQREILKKEIIKELGEILKDNQMGTIVTSWAKYDAEKEKYDHNHISIGFDNTISSPIPTDEYQEKMWKNAKWKKTKAVLVGEELFLIG
jgi:hypothetical protein